MAIGNPSRSVCVVVSHSGRSASPTCDGRRHAVGKVPSRFRAAVAHGPAACWPYAEELLQGGAAGIASSVCDLHGAGSGGAGAAHPSRRGEGVALRCASLVGVPARPGGTGFLGVAPLRLGGGGVPHRPQGAGAPGSPRAHAAGGSRAGATHPSGLLRVAGSPPGGRGPLGRRGSPLLRHRTAEASRRPGGGTTTVAHHDVPVVRGGAVADASHRRAARGVSPATRTSSTPSSLPVLWSRRPSGSGARLQDDDRGRP
jgi:hypothetical protein